MTNDQISMKEKKRIIREDEWLRAQERQPTDGKPPAPMSYHSRTISEEAFPRGRYSQEMASDVIGSGAPKYPAAGVSFPEFLNGPEYLGYEIDQLEECAGEPFEVAEAQQILDARMRAASKKRAGAAAAPSAVTPSTEVERSSTSPPRFRRRI